ncbi:hypothetical protein N7494_012526 [Penicillium frequentans]|uniref:Alpha/beta hydrolase fold-3 domain-containing protein n=1 Tax=Penicillium frequentans TaxID=3151616 RepID=A0AAD6GA57_9EURO|nr:hypothetical protein N7494_012526 [Penicillium glabrum]
MASIDDPTTWQQFGELDEEFSLMMAAKVPRKFPPVDLSNLSSIRHAWSETCTYEMETALREHENEVTANQIYIPLDHNRSLRALVFKPKKLPVTGSPLVVLIHGGGFLFGVAEMEASTCVHVTRKLGCISISLDYPLAPEAKFPMAYEDVWAGLQWIAGNAADLCADVSKGFILGGTSSGGQLAATLSLWARDRGLKANLTGIYLNATSIVDPGAVPEEYKRMYFGNEEVERIRQVGLSSKTVAMFHEAVQPDTSSEVWSPLLWRNGHRNLPPTYFQVCGADIQRNDSLVYERVLRLENGIETKADIYPGLPHVFWYMYPAHSACVKFHEDTVNGIAWLLCRHT